MTTTFVRSALAALACASLVPLSAPAFAASINLKADLRSSNEVPPVDSKGSGSVTATFDTAKQAAVLEGQRDRPVWARNGRPFSFR